MLEIEISFTKPQLKFDRRLVTCQAVLLALVLALTLAPRSQADTGTCSGQPITLPFTDVPGGNGFFCFIAQIYFQGITLGATATTYDPTGNVRRDQMAAFLARTQNTVLRRGNRRAALNQFWTTVPQYEVTQGAGMLGTTALGIDPQSVASDGADLWVTHRGSATVARVRASDGKLLQTWNGADSANGVLAAMGRIFVTGQTNPGKLYLIDPSQPCCAVTTLSSGLGTSPNGIAFDGQRIWTANNGTVSIITPGAPFTVTNVPGFGDLIGVLYDGANIWVTEDGATSGDPGSLKRLDASGGVTATITVGAQPRFPIYDGTNLWVPNAGSDSVSVVRASDGMVLATLTGNGLDGAWTAAFDGQRILVTNISGGSVSLFRAADFAPLGTVSTGASSGPDGACSDGLNFWITVGSVQGKLARF
jgi:hypothetical protein